MLAQHRRLVHVHEQAEHEGRADAHARGLVHAPEHDHQRQQVGHPGGAADGDHVDQQRHEQAGPHEDGADGQQELLLAGALDHRVAPDGFFSFLPAPGLPSGRLRWVDAASTCGGATGAPEGSSTST
ncbi:hypothetical protein FQZ97_771660 [compost metagenome]